MLLHCYFKDERLSGKLQSFAVCLTNNNNSNPMNAKLLMIVFILLGISEVSHGNSPGDSADYIRKEIKLSHHKPQKNRSVFIAPFRVFFDSSSLRIEEVPSCNSQSYVVTIKDASTNEPILIQSAFGDTVISIEGLPFGEYTLEIEMGELLLNGKFVVGNYFPEIEE